MNVKFCVSFLSFDLIQISNNLPNKADLPIVILE